MKKIISLLIGSFLFASTSFAAGMVGVKVGNGDLEGNADGYTAGSTTYTAISKSKSAEYGAIFAELELGGTPFSLGVEYIPFDAIIGLDGNSIDSHAEVSDYTTIYALASMDAGAGKAYVKAGYSEGSIGTIQSRHDSTVNSQSDSLEGPMIGIGFETGSLGDALDLVARFEATYTEFDDVSVTTTSNGSTSVKKTADGDLTTLSVSIGKKF